MKTTRINGKFKRMFLGAWRQKAKTHRCPNEPNLNGKIVAITGGNRGIGLETVKGLLNRGAEVIVLSRNKEKTEQENRALNGEVYAVKLDLGDISTINTAVEAVRKILKGRKIDVLINNAGIAVTGSCQLSPQGYELTFAVNVLGHHVLFQQLHTQSLLASNAQIISVTGDIYIQADDCTPNYSYDGKSGIKAYSRSKVGMMWWAYELHRLFPNYKMNLVHPGIVPSGLGNDENSFFVRAFGRLFITAEMGAQMTLICATQSNIENGAYYHNTLGKVLIPKNDIALNVDLSKQFWLTLEKIYDLEFKIAQI